MVNQLTATILGYRRIKPNRNATLGVPVETFGTSIVSSGYKTVGANPIINMSCYWQRRVLVQRLLDRSIQQANNI